VADDESSFHAMTAGTERRGHAAREAITIVVAPAVRPKGRGERMRCQAPVRSARPASDDSVGLTSGRLADRRPVVWPYSSRTRLIAASCRRRRSSLDAHCLTLRRSRESCRILMDRKRSAWRSTSPRAQIQFGPIHVSSPRPEPDRTRKARRARWRYSDSCVGALGRIRTPDPLIRSQVLYPTELPAHAGRCSDPACAMQGRIHSAAAPSAVTSLGSRTAKPVPSGPV
jgi:hypothetical protein